MLISFAASSMYSALASFISIGKSISKLSLPSKLPVINLSLVPLNSKPSSLASSASLPFSSSLASFVSSVSLVSSVFSVSLAASSA